MQDKEMIYRSEKPVDIGWQRMAALLDKEMPVQGKAKRRRLIVGGYWRGAVAAALVAAGLFVLLRLGMVSPADTPAVAHQEALHAVPPHAGVLTLPEEPCPDASVVSPAREAVVSANTKPAPSDLVPAWYSTTLTTHQSALWPGEMTETLPAVQEALPAAVSGSEEVSAAPIVTAEATPSVFGPVTPMSVASANVPIRASTPALHLSPPAAAAARKSSRWRLGVEATAGVHAANGALAYGVGPIVEYRTASPVSLRGGLQVASVDYQFSTKSANSTHNDNDPIVTGGGPSRSSLMEVVAHSVQRGYTWSFTTYSLQLPLTIGYALRPRVMLEAGLSPALISTISRLEGEVAADALFNVPLPTDADYYRNAVESSTERLDLLLSAGVRYQVTPHWAIGLQYQLGLNDLQPLTTIQARQQNMRLSGIYYF